MMVLYLFFGIGKLERRYYTSGEAGGVAARDGYGDCLF